MTKLKTDSPVILWFRRDLRTADHPALTAAVKSGAPVLCLYINHEYAGRPRGGASRWWLNYSLTALAADLKSRGAKLHILSGNPEILIPSVAKDTGARAVHWTRRYAGASIETDKSIKSTLKDDGVDAQSHPGNLLHEPWEVTTKSDDSYYKVFTPYWKACLARGDIDPALPAPEKITGWDGDIDGLSVDDLSLLPTAPDWAGGFDDPWIPGSKGAHKRLAAFLDGPVEDYKTQRNMAANENGTSGLSPHLAFGEISPREIWHETHKRAEKTYTFLSETGWREFSYVLLYHNPKLAEANYKDAFDAFIWDNDARKLKAWQRGQTGYPFVDAGMRQLWATGWMHNRVRMVTASFLIKHLLVDWRKGEDWFWDTLVDADPASNAASWQWVAGSGADASPYFRIFNPFTQGEKFDPDGDYVRRWVPELKHMPAKFIHRPWDAPALVLKEADVKLGGNYPKPIVDHKAAREEALGRYKDSRE
ncbi:cryptochrome/photolyase family protein [Robiginitomaculum antarcticum]|uniref:cryptochrome/photolyase family protein n=1 Tax=Robiginitomaculum antarcticum TaxID=437507 RepID=UPI00036D9B08|nr:deoxyribodipyrimidine photo-lyase [Robiginitomaculum antarcticum]